MASGRALRRLGVLVVAAAALLVAAPAGASAAVTPGTCDQDDPSADPTTEITDWTCVYEPVPVGGYEVQQKVVFNAPRPDVDAHITYMDMDVADVNGTPIPINRLMLHHIVFLNLDKQDKTCTGGYAGFGEEQLSPGGYAPERFAAAGEERMRMVFPPGYGYEFNGAKDGSRDTWAMVYMLMNHRKQTDTAYITYHLTTDPGADVEPARPYWFDIKNCRADPIYNVPGAGARAARKARQSGRKLTNTRSEDYTVHEDGWIIGGTGHVHGGALRLTLTKPSCNNSRIVQSTPTWGLAGHPFYNVRPILHEPGPIGMSTFSTPTGIPVTEGQKIRLNSVYDNMRPHTRVMGIYIVYIAEDDPGSAPSPQPCGGMPPDAVFANGTNGLAGRLGPIPFRIPLTGLDAGGQAIPINGPPGSFRRLRSGATVTVGDRFFSRPNIRLRQGATLNYRFNSSELHNLTLANGPLGIGSPNLDANRTFSQRFRRPGTYRFFCALHPVQMSERVVVAPKRHRRNLRRG